MSKNQKKTKRKPPIRVPGKTGKDGKVKTYTIKPHRYSITFNVGTPAYYENPEELSKEVDGYFEYIKGESEIQEVEVPGRKKKQKVRVWTREPEPPTVTGLCLYLGFASLQSLSEYEKKGGVIGDIIKRGKTRVANRYEQNLSGSQPTGSIFALKVMGWKEGSIMDQLNEMGIVAFNYVVPQKPKDE